MKITKLENTEAVEQIKGHTSRLLVRKCPDQRSVFPTTPCTNTTCDWAIRKPGYMNCTFVAATAEEDGEDQKTRGMTLEAIGEATDMTREAVRLIERGLLRKLRHLVDPEEDVEPTAHQPNRAAGRDHLAADHQADERPNEHDLVRALRSRGLG